MKAVVIARFGGPEVLELRDRPTPAPARGEVRIRVHATAVNRADLLQRQGQYPAPTDAPADIPGLEFAGEVDAIGESVADLAVGDRVFGLCGGGAYAEAIAVPARTAVKLPEGMSWEEGAAVAEAFITAWDALVIQARLVAGETVLIHGAGSGVGTAAIQIARAIGARAVGTSRTPDKLERARALGLDQGVAIGAGGGGGGFADAVLRATGGRGADVVLELVGGPYLAEDLLCVAPRGRIMLVGVMGGGRVELDLKLLLQRRIQLTGTVLRARPLEEKIAAVQQLGRHLVPLFARGALRPIVDRVLPLAEAAAAHAYVASNVSFGKVVLRV
ncbi:MAG TPA: NAD(P)H-quinone oxidoreductase [Polyangia bacterium]|nr:NAD(P)H-quinone oxidoreductase [Polyangia bacterium]